MRATFIVCSDNARLMASVFQALEKEFRSRKGSVEARLMPDGCLEVVAVASDLTGLRSLVNGVAKSIYLIEVSISITSSGGSDSFGARG